jgi:glycogen debranching enzyme
MKIIPSHGTVSKSLGAMLAVLMCCGFASNDQTSPLQDLAIHVPGGTNRQVSYTNKRSAYYYTQTARNDHPEHAWFRGFNIAGRRIFNDVAVVVRGKVLDPVQAQAVIRPDALIRRYPGGVVETITLFDERDLLEIRLQGAGNAAGLGLRLSGDQLSTDGVVDGVTRYRSTTDGRVDHVAVRRVGDRFLIAIGDSREAAAALSKQAAASGDDWQDQRRKRIGALINGDHTLTVDDQRTMRALRWLTLTTDQLITQQRGEGIYAGLPWFNEYWGRDSFIALPGATLVTGQFETARSILQSFAQFQNLDPDSRFYGRVPNIVKPDALDYHTTDGTPRFVLSLRDYVRYSGDRSLAEALYPNVRASIEGALKNWTDANGLLIHADNETWMDARRNPDLVSYSPRATRANDIQALWYEQLLAGAAFAAMQGDRSAEQRWTTAAQRVRSAFVAEFVDARTGAIADHLDAAGKPDFTLRPNVFFALDMVPREVADRTLKQAWQTLVFPWGVATLDPADPFFHPYHLALERYPKDEAYHNGTVWPWLDGIALQRMIERGGIDKAWPLFSANNDLALDRGAAGSLPETLDAYPHPGESAPRLTGTFLQAWSNTEQLRVWYQYVLGVRPDMSRDEILLAPRLPAKLNGVEFRARVGGGSLSGSYRRMTGGWRYDYELHDVAASLRFDLAPFREVTMKANPGDKLMARRDGGTLKVSLTGPGNVVRKTLTLAPDPDRQRELSRLQAEFSDLHYATPDPVIRDRVPHGSLPEPPHRGAAGARDRGNHAGDNDINAGRTPAQLLAALEQDRHN